MGKGWTLGGEGEDGWRRGDVKRRGEKRKRRESD